MRAAILLAALVAGLVPVAAPAQTKEKSTKPTMPVDAPFLTGIADATAFEKLQTERLARAREALGRLEAVKGKRTVENTVAVYDEILRHAAAAGNQSGLISQVHPNDAMRETGEKMVQEVEAFDTELSLDRGVYDALAAVDLTGADAVTRTYVERTLREFRLEGVDKDDATRAKIKTVRDELVEIGQEFDKNIREGVRTVTVDDAKLLDGLPADYVARKKPGADGKITLTTDYPDSLPVFSYATSEELRKRMYFEYNNRAYPANEPVLERLVAKRHELANLLGFATWADYVTADKMVGSAKAAAEFVDRVVAASGPKAEREYRELLERKRKDVRGADAVNAWESTYYSELVRKANYEFDSQSVRPYFQFDRVQAGVLDVASRLFGVEFRRNTTAPVWHPSVECYEMFEDGKLVGRFYLDLHPRENKYKHAAHFAVRLGVAGVQIPESALVCNFPGGVEGDPGLMEHDDVQTFFHEFGHLLHSLFAGRHKWMGYAGVRTERDFVEAPSQLLEEWAWDPKVLATFAKHYQTNEPIPAPLVAQMKRASEFGKALGVRRQMVYAKMSLSAYDRDPAKVDFDSLNRELVAKYQPYPHVDGTHFYTSFGHLNGYSAVYYTYMWSLVIAKDMFSEFDRANMMKPDVAERYRATVLAPGGYAPAAKLVESFLGRPSNFEAWERWLNEGDSRK
jgi:thimet oligopeptidase